MTEMPALSKHMAENEAETWLAWHFARVETRGGRMYT